MHPSQVHPVFYSFNTRETSENVQEKELIRTMYNLEKNEEKKKWNFFILRILVNGALDCKC